MGGQHYEDEGKERDELRTMELSRVGVEILRFSDNEILTNLEGVCEVIQRVIEKKRANSPSPQSSPHWERGSKESKKNCPPPS